MKDEELEKTKPIEVLSELSRVSKNENTTLETREEKFQDAVLNEEKIVEEKEMQEKAEEALAEKNIAEAEAILEKEREEKEVITPDIVVKDKENIFKKIGNRWKKLDKQKKTLIIVILLLVIVLIGVLVTWLLLNNKKAEPNKPDEPNKVPEEAPVIVDNFYYRDGKLYFTTDEEEVLGNYECENKDSNLCYVGFNNARDNFNVTILQDETGKELAQRFDIYEDRYVFIVDNRD